MSAKPTVLITGATGKLGRSFALGFAGLGYDIVIPARRADAAEALRNECLAAGAGRVFVIGVDLSAPDAVSLVAEQLATNDIWPTVLVNNARDVANLRMDSDG